ncbi:hypothetical protein [Streptomyces sp. NBC_00439]|nr:hypothetical protein [Streptomyces sp. NBC_00439]MCX5101440.1 hypothetical protein [Streptomyces sp. NBC_00439]
MTGVQTCQWSGDVESYAQPAPAKIVSPADTSAPVISPEAVRPSANAHVP